MKIRDGETAVHPLNEKQIVRSSDFVIFLVYRHTHPNGRGRIPAAGRILCPPTPAETRRTRKYQYTVSVVLSKNVYRYVLSHDECL